MLASELTIFSVLCVLFLLVGSVIGWIVRSFLFTIQSRQIYTHPEMFDSNGNIIPDEILAVRFENDYDSDEIDDEEE